MNNKPKIPQNEEHHQAHQAQIDEGRIKHLATLDEETRKLIFEAEVLSGKLAEKNMAHVMFIDCKQTSDRFDFYRYNYVHKNKYNDRFTKEAMKELRGFFADLVPAFVDFCKCASNIEIGAAIIKENDEGIRFEDTPRFKNVMRAILAYDDEHGDPTK